MQTISAIPLEDGRRHGAEAALIQEAQQDRAAFAPLYQRYRDRVYAYLRTRTESAEDAADLTQQVFLQALDALPRYRVGQAPFAAWLLRIAHNAAARYHRRRRLTLAWDLVPESLHPVTADDPEAQALRGEDIARLRALLRTCTPGTREVLALRFAARLSVAETAAVVGKSEAAVKKQLTRAISALKEQYHDPVQEPGGVTQYIDAQSYITRGADWTMKEGPLAGSSWHTRLLQFGTVPASAVPAGSWHTHESPPASGARPPGPP